MVLRGDCIERLREFSDNTFRLCITSPPFWLQRNYGMTGQIGLEPEPDLYVRKLVEVGREVRRILKPDGNFFLNLGDTYISSGGTGRRQLLEGLEPRAGLKIKSLVGIPWRVALALQADGWTLRQEIIWHKPAPLPEKASDRCTRAHETIFHFVKHRYYFFNSEANQEPASEWGKRESAEKGSFEAKAEPQTGRLPFRAVKKTRNRRSVWTIPTDNFRGGHCATFPTALVEPLVLTGSQPGDHVIDPFAGAGTVGVVCKKHSRIFTGIELNPDYVTIAQNRIAMAEGSKCPL